MDKEYKKENGCLSPAWQPVEEISLSLSTGYDWQIENQIVERLQMLSIPMLNQQQINRAIRKVVNAAYDKSELLKERQGKDSFSSMTIRMCLQSAGETADPAEAARDGDAASCWGFFLVESNAHQPENETGKHVLDVFIYRE